MRSFLILLAAMLAFSTLTPTALAADYLDKISRLKKGMTYEEVLNVMGREPELKDSLKTSKGTLRIYAWQYGDDYLRTTFWENRLSEFGMLMDRPFKL
jgi:hypothetical protein